MKFDSGEYYVGDPGVVLPSDDLRMLFSEIFHNRTKSGKKILVTSIKINAESTSCDLYWLVFVPVKAGTLYDQDGKGWGFDWGCFGVIPWQWIENKGSYSTHKIEFTEPFECFFNDNEIKIGHLNFNFNPK